MYYLMPFNMIYLHNTAVDFFQVASVSYFLSCTMLLLYMEGFWNAVLFHNDRQQIIKRLQLTRE